LASRRVRPLRHGEFVRLRELVLREAGIHLSDAKKALLVARLGRRLEALELGSFDEYFQRVSRDPVERTLMVEALCTHETAFFRHPSQFRMLADQAVPGWLAEAATRERSRVLRIWSAGCSNGAEAYSVAMLLLSRMPDWNLEIWGTDVSMRILREAQAGIWPIEKASQIPAEYLRRFMRQGVGSRAGWMKAGSELRAVVHFRPLNLSRSVWDLEGPFDLILCRNVLIYFHPATRARALARLADQLAPKGFLLLGPGEAPTLGSTRLKPLSPTIYGLTRAFAPLTAAAVPATRPAPRA
jgi:chemotaxis protein methyltransferase CheR